MVKRDPENLYPEEFILFYINDQVKKIPVDNSERTPLKRKSLNEVKSSKDVLDLYPSYDELLSNQDLVDQQRFLKQFKIPPMTFKLLESNLPFEAQSTIERAKLFTKFDVYRG